MFEDFLDKILRRLTIKKLYVELLKEFSKFLFKISFLAIIFYFLLLKTLKTLEEPLREGFGDITDNFRFIVIFFFNLLV